MHGRGIDGPPLNLHDEDLKLSPIEQIFVCRKAIGYFFMKPTTAASILVSMLRISDTEVAEVVRNLLADPLLLNYGGILEYLEGIAPDDPAKEHIDEALTLHEAYIDALKEVPAIKELQPSEHHRRIEHVRMSDQMREANKQAQEQSVFLGIVKHSVILYGNRSLNFIKSTNNVMEPMKMDLKSHSISYEMPRMEIADPVGLDYVLRIFRNERIVK